MDPASAQVQVPDVASLSPPKRASAFSLRRLVWIFVVVLVLVGIVLGIVFAVSGGSGGASGLLSAFTSRGRGTSARGRYVRVQRSKGSPGRIAVTEVEVIDNKGRKIWLRHNVDGVNATATPALISTTEFHTPNLIYDGNTRARLPALTDNAGADIMNANGKKLRFALTGVADDAQVQIDMGATRSVSKIIVYNNDLDEYKDSILGCEVTFSSSDGQIVFRSPPITEVRNRYEFHVAATPAKPSGVTAQYVRLQLRRSEILHINEMQVIGPDGQVYADAVATSSSIHTTKRNILNEEGKVTGTEDVFHTGPHGPQHVTNGFLWRTIPGGVTIAGASTWAMFQSRSEPGAWVQLNLGSPKPVSQVVIYNRNWDGADRIAPAQIILFDTPPESGGASLFTHDILTNEDRYELDVEHKDGRKPPAPPSPEL
jgi:hypothetical protein